MPGKVRFIFLVFLIITGCSSVKNNSGRTLISGGDTNYVKSKQIPFKSILIPRVQIEIDINGRRETLIATIRYNDDNWLFSVRSEDGIEIVRAFISKDTVLINDRLNRKLYHGSSVNLRRSYGFGQEDLPLVFGVFQMNFLVNLRTDCVDGLMHIEGTTDGLDVSSDYNCNTSLTQRISMSYKGVKDGLLIEYLKFKSYGNINLPSLIEIRVPEEQMDFVIRISKHQINEIVNTDFIPGNNYDKVLIK